MRVPLGSPFKKELARWALNWQLYFHLLFSHNRNNILSKGEAPLGWPPDNEHREDPRAWPFLPNATFFYQTFFFLILFSAGWQCQICTTAQISSSPSDSPSFFSEMSDLHHNLRVFPATLCILPPLSFPGIAPSLHSSPHLCLLAQPTKISIVGAPDWPLDFMWFRRRWRSRNF